MKRINKQYFIASVDESHLEQIDKVAAVLKSKGCEISKILKLTGVITGKVSTDTKLMDLKIEGINSIEKQKAVSKK
jgi:hypothetical protein